VLFLSEGPLIPVPDMEIHANEARVLAAAARAHVSIYAISPAGLDHPTAFGGRGMAAVPLALDSHRLQRSRDLNMGAHAMLGQRRLMAASALAVPAADAAIIRDRGLRFMQTLTLAPGRYQQRIAAGRSFAYVVDRPLKSLAPGRYTLRVEARAEGAEAVVARETSFDVRSAAP